MSRQEGEQGGTVRPAVRWFFRLSDSDNQPLESDELQQWERFTAESEQRKELARIKEFWRAIRAVGGPRSVSQQELDEDDYDGSIPVREWMAQRAMAQPARTQSLARPRTLRMLAAAAVGALVIGIGLYAQPWLAFSGREQSRAFATPVAEQRQVRLADGSIVTLGARTEIHARITTVERIVVLDRGEAWFKVAHEPDRPFRVMAGSGVITAVGTEFNVRRDRDKELDRVTVTVGDGVVKIEPRATVVPDAGSASPMEIEPPRLWQPTRLARGQELSYDAEGDRGSVRPADVEAAAAWKVGRLEYIHQPLKAVVVSVNRYSAKPIVIADEVVGELDFSGTVFEDQIDDWIRALETAFPVSVTETDEHILIQSRG